MTARNSCVSVHLTEPEIEQFFEGPKVPKLKNSSRRQLANFLPKYDTLLGKIDVLKRVLKKINNCANCPCGCTDKVQLPASIQLDHLWQRVNNLKLTLLTVVASIEAGNDQETEIRGVQTILYLSSARENEVNEHRLVLRKASTIHEKYQKKVAKFSFQCKLKSVRPQLKPLPNPKNLKHFQVFALHTSQKLHVCMQRYC